ncbi:MAG: dephospho-CoA kinase [Elusimicrobia bacterium]|nr:dephospho-CoA kinase [Elusimicrobiota bacterium]
MKNDEIEKRFKKIRKKKLIVGLTGQIGSGKSTALEYLASGGIFTVSTDRLAGKILTFKKCYSKLINRFGKTILNKDGSLNRYLLSEVIFTDKAKRKWLEGLLHPLIIENTILLIEKCGEKTAVIDAPLLFETGFDKYCDIVVSVCADKKIQRERLLRRDWSKRNIESRIKSQFSSELKAELSDIVIVNDSSLKCFYEKLNDLQKMLKILCPKHQSIKIQGET